ncbi:MAG TPA: DNA repair protein RadA [Lentimicrobium sp.]|nr:DNA repair protein RadA [Lentimicrobium sp.]
MAKAKTAFFCRNCGAESPKWLGKCPACGEWNTYTEEVLQKNEKGLPGFKIEKQPVPIGEVSLQDEQRLDTCNGELNRVLGGGLVQGSVVLIGGEPGIGKSTLMLQVALNIKNQRFLYVSGEESEQQIRMRAERIGIRNSECFILTETSSSNVINQCEKLKPQIVLIDSIQTMMSDNLDSSPGSISQIKETAFELLQYAKRTNIPVFLIGHITKDGTLAGPKVLEHMVDAVLQFEGDRNYGFRILRSVKNRYGSTSELGIYEMNSTGLKEITNPSEILLGHFDEMFSGTAIAATLEGMRPMLIETQALVSTAAYGTPQRSCTGFDTRRLNMLLAVLEKKCGFKLGTKDVFLNIAGGIKVADPATDLAIVSAILSSNIDMALQSKVCFAAEVGLSGEIRPVNRIEQRVSEAEKIGFNTIYISKSNLKAAKAVAKQIKVLGLSRIEELGKLLFTN